LLDACTLKIREALPGQHGGIFIYAAAIGATPDTSAGMVIPGLGQSHGTGIENEF
jgi:hypothetical protein